MTDYNADTIPAPPVPSASPAAERDQLERKNRLLLERVAKLEGELSQLSRAYRALLNAAFLAAQELRGALKDEPMYHIDD